MPALLPSPLLATSIETDADTDALDDLRCPICFALMLAPRVLPGCASRHAFCEPCIRFWLQLQREGALPDKKLPKPLPTWEDEKALAAETEALRKRTEEQMKKYAEMAKQQTLQAAARPIASLAAPAAPD